MPKTLPTIRSDREMQVQLYFYQTKYMNKYNAMKNIWVDHNEALSSLYGSGIEEWPSSDNVFYNLSADNRCLELKKQQYQYANKGAKWMAFSQMQFDSQRSPKTAVQKEPFVRNHYLLPTRPLQCDAAAAHYCRESRAVLMEGGKLWGGEISP